MIVIENPDHVQTRQKGTPTGRPPRPDRRKGQGAPETALPDTGARPAGARPDNRPARGKGTGERHV